MRGAVTPRTSVTRWSRTTSASYPHATRPLVQGSVQARAERREPTSFERRPVERFTAGEAPLVVPGGRAGGECAGELGVRPELQHDGHGAEVLAGDYCQRFRVRKEVRVEVRSRGRQGTLDLRLPSQATRLAFGDPVGEL